MPMYGPLANPFRLYSGYTEKQKIQDLQKLVKDLNIVLAQIGIDSAYFAANLPPAPGNLFGGPTLKDVFSGSQGYYSRGWEL